MPIEGLSWSMELVKIACSLEGLVFTKNTGNAGVLLEAAQPAAWPKQCVGFNNVPPGCLNLCSTSDFASGPWWQG